MFLPLVFHGTQKKASCLKAVLRNGQEERLNVSENEMPDDRNSPDLLRESAGVSHGYHATVCLQRNGTSTQPVRNTNYAQAKCTAWPCCVNLSGGLSKRRRAEGCGGLDGGQRDAYSPDVDGGQHPPLYAGGTARR